MKIIRCLAVFLMCVLFASGCGSKAESSAKEIESAAEETGNLYENETNADTDAQETTDKEILKKEASEVSTEEISEGNIAEEIKEKTEISEEPKSSVSVNEDNNKEHKQQRIIATSAAICDITDRLGIELIGVPETTVSAIASRYDGVTTVGTPMSPDMEIIKSLNPTDVLSPDTLEGDLKIQYDNIGVNSTFLNLRSVEGLYESVKLIGEKYGKSEEADKIAAEYNEFMESYSSKHSGEKPKVLVLMGLPGSYLVATQNSYAGSLVELAGGENVFHDDAKDFITVNTEEILAKDPDVIIRTAHGLPKEALEMFEKEFSENDIWKHFRAVKENRVYDVDYMLFGMSAAFDYPQALADLEPMLFQ